MLQNNIKNFKKLIELAEKNRLEYEKDMCDGIIISDLNVDSIDELSKKSSTEKELQELLESLDFESISNVCSIMYLGRDRDYNKLDSPEEILRKQKKYIDKTMGYNKDIMIDMITEKVPLDKYLRSGFDILGINI
ncbi:DUF3775 domain-containing protein [Clostridium tarantellae]|uniref:DUF3775 domain-containing protein n=1 Tax=Clostridium tarantellae TaxID=39493 RepID=A0A6I1MRE9_9CLOT|nr:DUF3775 domain-containing protein [Clostridium tarantellae]MPQ42859.1 DUF3775 domain-containing protein [Clostridium tarantellae]